MTGADHHRIVGLLAVTLQTYPRGPLSAATRVRFHVSERGQIVLAWQGGPTTFQVASALQDAAVDPDMPITDEVDPPALRQPTSLRLRIGEIFVLLQAYEPDPTQPRKPVGHPETPAWPRALATDGAARHLVIWTAAPDGDTGAATVVELHADLGITDEHWTETGHLIVDANMHFGDHAEAARRRWHHHRDHATVLMRAAGADTTLDDADYWACAQQGRNPGGIPHAAAVGWADQTCLIRVVSPKVGWHIIARAPGRPYPTTALLPAAVLDAINKDPIHRPPRTLSLQRFGNAHSEQHWTLETEPVVPHLRP